MTGAARGIAGFAERYPRAWHVIEAEGAGCEILYPAATLRRLSGLPASSANRDSFQRLNLPGGTAAVLRLQLMPDARLVLTLGGDFAGRPDLWRDHIDQHVFFWLSEDRVDRFLRACVRLRARETQGPAGPPVVIEADTLSLLTAHAEAFFSCINTGSTLRGGARVRRDETTLRALQLWRGERAVELAFHGPVTLPPDALSLRAD